MERAQDRGSSACDLLPRQLLRVWEGTKAPASGEIQIVAAEPDYVGGGLSHAGPWDYVQQVPLFFYGPGRVPALGRVDGRATLADIAPTNAEMLGFDFDAPDGHVLAPVLLPDGERAGPPKLLVTLVWDGAGRNVLDEWPEDWPFLAGLIDRGVWFDDAEIGSSPSNTPPIHATIGTGAFPRRHGVIDLYQQIDGEIDKPQQEGPGTLLLPTLADLFDVAHGNEPLVGVIATLGAHTGMVGHGSQWDGRRCRPRDHARAGRREHRRRRGRRLAAHDRHGTVLRDARLRERGARSRARSPDPRSGGRRRRSSLGGLPVRRARRRLPDTGAHARTRPASWKR